MKSRQQVAATTHCMASYIDNEWEAWKWRVLFCSWCLCVCSSCSIPLFFYYCFVLYFAFVMALSVAWSLIFGLQLTLLRLAFCFLTWLPLRLYLGPHLIASHNTINITVKDVSSLPVLNFSGEIILQSGLMKLIISYYLVSSLWHQSRWTNTLGSVKYCMAHFQSPELVFCVSKQTGE